MYEYLDKRYALALYQVAEEKGKVDEYLSNLREIVELFETNNDFLQLIKHPQISTSKKKKTFIKIFKNRVDEELLSFLLILIEKDRILYVKEKLSEMEKIHLERNNTLLAQVKTVVPLNDIERNTLIEKLEINYNKKIILKEELEKAIIGGVYVRIGNDVIDGTIRSKLDEMKALILKRE